MSKVISVAFLLIFLISGCSGRVPGPSAGSLTAIPATPGTARLASPSAPERPAVNSSPSPVPATQAAAPTVEDSATPAPTASPTATALPAVPGELAFPIRAAFYYPWFPQAWNQSHMNPFTHYHPTLGFYSEDDAQVIQQQIIAMQYGKIQAGIASWWGQGDYTDGRIPALLQAGAADHFLWGLYIESEGVGDPTADTIRSDLVYIRDHYASSPAYLKIAGHFVVFVYAQPQDACGMADRWKQANTVGAYVVLKVFAGYQKCASQPDAWHQYAPAGAEKQQGTQSFTISPGFWKASEAEARLDRDLARWSQSIRAMIASKANFQLITTFNEWGEGTAVESAREWTSPSGYGAYLDALHLDGAAP